MGQANAVGPTSIEGSYSCICLNDNLSIVVVIFVVDQADAVGPTSIEGSLFLVLGPYRCVDTLQ